MQDDVFQNKQESAPFTSCNFFPSNFIKKKKQSHAVEVCWSHNFIKK